MRISRALIALQTHPCAVRLPILISSFPLHKYQHAPRQLQDPVCYLWLANSRPRRTGSPYPWPLHHMRPPSRNRHPRQQKDLIVCQMRVLRSALSRMIQPTIDACLELLSAYFTGQVSQAQFLV